MSNSVEPTSANAAGMRHDTGRPEPTVFVIDDDLSVRKSLESLVRFAGWQVLTYASAQCFLKRPRLSGPGCLVLDVSLPGIDGLELQERLSRDQHDLRIVFTSAHGDVPTTVRAMKAGAVEFLTKPLDEEALLRAIGEAIERSRAALEQHSVLQKLRADYASLSKREQEVMGMLVSGLMNKQVGGNLGIAEVTVKAHRGQVMRKMKARSFAELVNMAVNLGIVSQVPAVLTNMPNADRETL
jgi:FixJ family two-component response regulator